MATIAPNTPSSPVPQGGSSVATNIPESRRRSGSFTNLQSYIQANRDTTRDQADKVAQDIESRGQKALGDIQNESQRAITDVQNVGPKIEEADIESSVQSIFPGPSATPGGTNALTASNTPFNTEQLDQTRSTITGLRDANPNTVQYDFSDAANRARRAEQEARMLGSTEGLQSLINQGQERPDYTQGESRLDTLLLQSIPESRQRFANLQQNLIGTTDPALEQATTGVRTAIDERAARLAALRQFADEKLANQINTAYETIEQRRPELNNQVSDRAKEISNQYNDYYNTLLSGGAVNQGFLDKFGQVNRDRFISAGGGKTAQQLVLEAAGNPQERIQGLGIENFLQNPDEAARLNALYGLRGDLGQAGEDFQAKQYTADPMNVDQLLFDGQLPNMSGRVKDSIQSSLSDFNTKTRDLSNNIMNSASSVTGEPPSEVIASLNDYIEKGAAGPKRIRVVEQTLKEIEKQLPNINQTLKTYGFNPVGNDLVSALNKFGYTGEYPFRPNGSSLIHTSRLSGSQRHEIGRATKELLNLLSSGLGNQQGNIPDVYVPPTSTPNTPLTTNPDGSQNIPGFFGGGFLTT